MFNSRERTFIEAQNNTISAKILDIKNKQTRYGFLRQRRNRLFILFIIFSIVVPLITFYYVIQRRVTDEPDKSYTCVVVPTYRVPCGVSSLGCRFVSCCYDPVEDQCYHAIPSRYNYYKKDSDIHYQPSLNTTPFSTTSIDKLYLSIGEIDADRVQIVLHDPSITYKTNEIVDKNYVIRKDETLLGVEVFRKATMEMLLTTFRGPLVASKHYLEWTFQLTNENLIGLGEIYFNGNETVTKVIYRNENDHNTLPVFMAYSKGYFHGASVEHEGLLEVSVLPSKLIVLKSLGGSKIILNLFVGGNNPSDVVNQLRNYEHDPIPYWVLGAHICRDGLTTLDLAIQEYKKFAETETTIHFTSDCIHENLYFMLNGTTEINNELKKLIQDLQIKSHFMLSVTPHVQTGSLHNKALELDLLYYSNKTGILKGTYLEQKVAYPDFTHKSINTWMTELKPTFPADKIDGFVLRSNWPVDENYMYVNQKRFPYLTKAITEALGKTIPVDAFSKSETPTLEHLLKHNQFGSAQVTAFKNNFKDEFLMTSSYDHNIPAAALVQNMNISWASFKKVITTTLYNSILGNPLISIPICGSTRYYNKDLHEELCIRWYTMAATFPLFRISSELPRRDPFSLSTKFATNISASALKNRLLLLPYYYTTLNLEHMLVKPMFYDFYLDDQVWTLDEQYMLGNALLIAHPVLPHSSKLQVYLPSSAGVWYEFWGGRRYPNGWSSMNIVVSDWVMFIRQGQIVPLREAPELSKIGSFSPNDAYIFAVALNCSDTIKCNSEGQLMLTSTVLKLRASQTEIVISNVILAKRDIGCEEKRTWPSIIRSVIIYGIENDTVVYSNFKSIDICNMDVDDIRMKYF